MKKRLDNCTNVQYNTFGPIRILECKEKLKCLDLAKLSLPVKQYLSREEGEKKRNELIPDYQRIIMMFAPIAGFGWYVWEPVFHVRPADLVLAGEVVFDMNRLGTRR